MNPTQRPKEAIEEQPPPGQMNGQYRYEKQKKESFDYRNKGQLDAVGNQSEEGPGRDSQ